MRAPHESPAILLEIVPVPVGQDGIEQRHDFLRRLGNLCLHPRDLLLRFVALDVSFEDNFPRDGLGCFAPRLVLERTLDDRFQLFHRRFRQTFVDGFVHVFPLWFARGGEGIRAVHDHRDQDDRKDASHNSDIVRLAD